MTKRTGKQLAFRIIAGELKGKRVTVPDLGVTRPPLSRLRRSIFDLLTPYLEEATYLDLFSGTGSYLFEAVSRGAANALGVEHEMRLAQAINRQAEVMNVADRLACLNRDVFVAIPELAARKRKFDIVTIAPPQYRRLIDSTLQALKKWNLVKADGLLVCQHGTSETEDIGLADFAVVRRRRYGNTTFTVLRQD